MTASGQAVARGVEQPGGKGRGDENFPVGSWLIAPALRPHVHAFYGFARLADDVADSPDLAPAEKLRRLDRMAAVLDGAPGADAPAAARMRQSLAASGVAAAHCHQLLDAFRQDAAKGRYADWGELMGYCRLSAAPVGRYLLDLHGESPAAWPASDALCAALQVINHLQDCGDDYRRLDRVYLPLDMLAAEGAAVDMLARGPADPRLLRALRRVADATWSLVENARRLPPLVASWGLRAESSVIVALAERLLERLGREDPLAARVALGPGGVALAASRGLVRVLWRRPS